MIQTFSENKRDNTKETPVLDVEGYRGFTMLHLIKRTQKKYAFIESYDNTSRKSMRKEEDTRLVNSSSKIHLFLTPKYEKSAGDKKASMNYK